MYFPILAPRLINLELKAKTMTLQVFEKEDWLERVFRKSESARSKDVAKTALNMFDYYCKHEGTTIEDKVKQYQDLAKQGDIRSICLDLDRFVQFLNQDQPDIILNSVQSPTTFKKKSGKTIRNYFGFIKSYLRLCHAIKLTNEDIQDYVTFPKQRKDQRRPISIEVLKRIFNHASPTRRTLYCVLVSSGMRLGEAMALRKKDFHLEENPVRITIDAEITKTKEGRETYISSEAVDKLKEILDSKNDNDLVFTRFEDNVKAVNNEVQYFIVLRERLDLLEKYPNSPRHIVNIHCFRAYFHTKASQKHGSDYANALDGHGSYLKQYYREDPKERAKKYQALEPSLLVESYKLESEKTKDKIIEDMQEEMKKLQAKMTRLEILNNPIHVL